MFTDKMKRAMIKRCYKAVDTVTDDFLRSVNENTPEDTRTLLRGNRRTKLTISGNIISAKVENKTEYGIYVEKGIAGKIFRYNKPKGKIFKKSTGARMFEIALFQNQGSLKTKIELGKKIK